MPLGTPWSHGVGNAPPTLSQAFSVHGAEDTGLHRFSEMEEPVPHLVDGKGEFRRPSFGPRLCIQLNAVFLRSTLLSRSALPPPAMGPSLADGSMETLCLERDTVRLLEGSAQSDHNGGRPHPITRCSPNLMPLPGTFWTTS